MPDLSMIYLPNRKPGARSRSQVSRKRYPISQSESLSPFLNPPQSKQMRTNKANACPQDHRNRGLTQSGNALFFTCCQKKHTSREFNNSNLKNQEEIYRKTSNPQLPIICPKSALLLNHQFYQRYAN